MMTVYFRRTCGDHSSLHFNGTDLQKVKSCYKRYLGVPCTSQVTRPWHLTPSAYLERRKFWAFSLPAEELNSLFHSPHLLQGDNREHPDKLFHCLVWQLHHLGLQDPTAYHEDSWTDYCCFFIPTTETSSVASERLLALCLTLTLLSWTLHFSAVWRKVWENLCRHHQQLQPAKHTSALQHQPDLINTLEWSYIHPHPSDHNLVIYFHPPDSSAPVTRQLPNSKREVYHMLPPRHFKLLYMQRQHRHPWLASVVRTDRENRVCHLSFPESTGQFFLSSFRLRKAMASEPAISWWWGECFPGAPFRSTIQHPFNGHSSPAHYN